MVIDNEQRYLRFYCVPLLPGASPTVLRFFHPVRRFLFGFGFDFGSFTVLALQPPWNSVCCAGNQVTVEVEKSRCIWV